MLTPPPIPPNLTLQASNEYYTYLYEHENNINHNSREERIRRLAYIIWVHTGCEDSAKNWQDAEKALDATAANTQ